MAGSKAGVTKALVATRVAAIERLLSQGAARWRIQQFAADEGWGIAERTVDEYIRKATHNIALSFDEKREEFVARQLARLEHIADLATKERQYSAAVGAACAILRTVGADAPK